MRPEFITRNPTLLLIFVVVTMLASDPAVLADGGPDAFGYSCTSSMSLYQWIEPQSPEPMLTSITVRLTSPIALYGVAPITLSAHRSGFLSGGAVAAADTTPDCPLPAAASEGRGGDRKSVV